jgi:hypothetical protein
MQPRELAVGDVVQIDPATPDCFFAGCLMIVSEPSKSWGAQGYFTIPHSRDQPPMIDRTEMPGLAYFRATWETMEFVGHAVWTRAESEEEEEVDR